jgi:hypothetical protein
MNGHEQRTPGVQPIDQDYLYELPRFGRQSSFLYGLRGQAYKESCAV